MQFVASHRQILVKAEVKSSSCGNRAQGIVSIKSGTVPFQESAGTAVTAASWSPVLQPQDLDYMHRVDYPESLSSIVGSVVPHIASFAARKVAATNSCEECVVAVQSRSAPP